MRGFRRLAFGLVSVAVLGWLLPPVAAAQLAPGTHVTWQTREQLKGLVPDEMYHWVVENNQELDVTIGAPRVYPMHPSYVEATVRYGCQARIDEKGVLVDYVAGQPFPYSDWATAATNHACDLSPDDPQFALKLAWNVNYRWQGGSGLNIPHWGFSNMRNKGKETWRIAQGEYRRTYFSHRADLLPETHELEENTDLEWAEFFDVKTPFDLRGTMFLLYRYNDNKEDQTWAYIPALRRVRRIAATQKSDSLLGTEFTLEDFYGFAGYVWDHEWQFGGESDLLFAVNSSRKCFPSVIGDDARFRTTGMARLGTPDEWNHCKFSPYKGLPMTGETWEMRRALRLDDIPRQKGHPYSRKALWYDKETLYVYYMKAWDRAGNDFKVLGAITTWSEDSGLEGNQGRQTMNYTLFGLANVQNDASHTGQFDNANAFSFDVRESRKYYDTSRLKRKGR